MTKYIKLFIFKSFGLKKYLRIVQRTYFLLYQTRILKLDPNYAYHYFVKYLINKGDVVIDIGANLGNYSILFAQWTGDTGKVFSVEPISVYNDIFNEKAKKYKNITLYPYALGTEEKIVELVSPDNGFLNTGLPHIYDSKLDGKLENQKFIFKAQMKKPSDLFNNFERINYIKCDIEGFEYVVLSDMKHIIKKNNPIVQVEVWPDNEKSVLSMFEDLDYSSYKMNKHKLIQQRENENLQNGDYIFIPNLFKNTLNPNIF